MTPLRHRTADIAVDILARKPDLVLSLDGTAHRVEPTEPPSPGTVAFRIDGIRREAQVFQTAEHTFVRFAGRTTMFARPRHGGGDRAAATGDVRADMPGVVVSVHCAAGDAVPAGAKLMTIESMKLQTTLAAPRDGVVARIHHAADEAFERGALLVSLETEAPAPRGDAP